MKRYIRAAFAAAMLASGLCAVRAHAQDDDAAAPPESSAQPRGDGGIGSRAAKRLHLTDEQSGKFEDALKAHAAAMKEHGREVRGAVRKLADDLKSKADDGELLAQLAALKAARKALAAENEKFESNLASFLTPEQRAKMAVGLAMRMRDRRGDGPRARNELDDGADCDRGGPDGDDGGQ